MCVKKRGNIFFFKYDILVILADFFATFNEMDPDPHGSATLVTVAGWSMATEICIFMTQKRY